MNHSGETALLFKIRELPDPTRERSIFGTILHEGVAWGKAILVVGESEDEYELWIGHMDPMDSVTGIHARLENLGYDTGGIHTLYDQKSTSAMQEFLIAIKANDNGCDPANPQHKETCEKLQEHYGS